MGASDLVAQRGGFERLEDLRRFGLTPPKPKVFVTLTGTIFRSTALKRDPVLEPLVRTMSRPTIVWIDWETRRHLDAGSRVIDLVYEGGSRWRVDEESPGLWGFGRPEVRYFTDVLSPQDLDCCSWPARWLQPEKRATMVSTIEYRGDVIAYPGNTNRMMEKTAALIDPRDGTVVLFYGPVAKVVWMLP